MLDPVLNSPAALATVAWLLPAAASLLGLSPADDPAGAVGGVGAHRVELAVAQRPAPEATGWPEPTSRSESEDRRRTGPSPAASPPATPPSTVVLRLPAEAHGVADGGVTRRDEDTLRACVQGNPLLSDGCVVSANPFEHLPRRPR